MVENEKPKLTRQLAEHIEDEFKHPNSKLTADVERWGEDTAQAMTRLCRAFPTLRGAPGSEPWDALPFLHWLCTSAAVTPACYDVVDCASVLAGAPAGDRALSGPVGQSACRRAEARRGLALPRDAVYANERPYGEPLDRRRRA
jgi:hypothetical protein